MSDCERTAQVAHDKWANHSFFWTNCSFALSLTKNEQFPQKNLTKLIFFCKFKKKELFAHCLFFNERCEPIAQVAHQKWAIWANHSGHPPKISDHERFTQVTHQNEQIAHYLLIFLQKTSNSLRKPMSEFPALTKRHSPSSSSSFSSPFPRYKAWCLLPVSLSSCSPACSAAHSPCYQVSYWTNLAFSSSYSS